MPQIEKMKDKLENMLKSPQKFSKIDRDAIKKHHALIVIKEMLLHVLQEVDHA